MMGPPRPGEILPTFLRRALDLSAEQKMQLDELQKGRRYPAVEDPH